MTLSQWFPIFSTIVCLMTPVMGLTMNLATAQTPCVTREGCPVPVLEQLTNPRFEVKGSQQQPRQVFIPGVNQLLADRQRVENYTGLSGYPLPSLATIALSYGWHQGADGQTTFHSGIDLLADPETPVLAVDTGIIAFAGQQGNYGNLVVINHQGGRQTRYAHLSRIAVREGQQVKVGTTLGTVGSTGSPDINPSHLHFEVRFNSPSGWVAQDPELHLTARP